MSAGGSKSSSSSSSQAQSFIDPVQASFLGSLWGNAGRNVNPNAMGAEAQAAAQPGAQASQAALTSATGIMRNPLAGQTSVLDNLSKLGDLGRAKTESAPALGTLRGLMDPSSQIAAQSSSLKSGLSSLFSEELNPAIRGNAIAAGGFGGGRQGVAQGQAVGQISDAYTQGLGDIVAGANAQAANAATGYSSILSDLRSGVLGAQGARSDIISNGRSASLDAASMIPMLGAARQGFATAGNQQQIAALQALASIFGTGGTVLNQAASGSGTKSGQFNFGFI